jgi:rhodanese-related sulfurtransferase
MIRCTIESFLHLDMEIFIMRSLTRYGAVLILAMTGTLALAQQQGGTRPPAYVPKAHVLTNVEFDKLREHPEKLLIIDLRRPDELSSRGGFPVYLSIQIDQLEQSLAWIPKDREIVTVSNHTVRSGKAADLLASKGYHVAGVIGALTYEEAGGTLAKVAVPPPR